MTAWAVAAALVGGALGAVVRYTISIRLGGKSTFPWPVLIVNLVGSAIAGVAMGLGERMALDVHWQYAIVSGLCAGLTTFSTWSLETVQLVMAGKARVALTSVVLNLLLGLGLAALGYLLTR
jgi:CrcB protein